MVGKFPPFRSERKTVEEYFWSLPSKAFTRKLLFHLTFNQNFRIFFIFVKMISTLVKYGSTPSPIPRREFRAVQVRQVISGTHRVTLVILELTFSAAAAALQRSQ